MRKLMLLLSPLLLLSACGSGGGDDSNDFIGAAMTAIEVSPHRIDTGDRALVTSNVGQVHKNGIALKFRYPAGASYVPGSARITIEENETTISPTVNEVSESEGVLYLVFYLKQQQFAPSGEAYDGQFADVSFQIEGISPVRTGKVEVDADVDDPLVDNAVEFSIATPDFSAEDISVLEVTG